MVHTYGSGTALLHVRDVSFAYEGQPDTLSHVTFDLRVGELCTLLGPNGAGKSTLLNCIMNLLAGQRGSIELDGRDTSRMSAREIARVAAYVPQTSNVAFSYDVRDYVAMGRTPHLKLCATPSAQDMRLVDEALERLAIEGLARRPYNELSGGQRQLVDVARALAQQPRLLLFDEPTSALDFGNQVRVLKLVADLAQDGYAILMTTHNPDHPILLGGSVCLLGRDGRLEKGSVCEVLREKKLRELYGCDLIVRHMPDAGRDVCVAPSFSKINVTL